MAGPAALVGLKRSGEVKKGCRGENGGSLVIERRRSRCRLTGISVISRGEAVGEEEVMVVEVEVVSEWSFTVGVS